MDKILSARVDEEIILQITRISQLLKISKKKVIEDAVKNYVSQIDEHQNSDVLKETFGAWASDESPEETEKNSRKAFKRSMKRHHS